MNELDERLDGLQMRKRKLGGPLFKCDDVTTPTIDERLDDMQERLARFGWPSAVDPAVRELLMPHIEDQERCRQMFALPDSPRRLKARMANMARERAGYAKKAFDAELEASDARDEAAKAQRRIFGLEHDLRSVRADLSRALSLSSREAPAVAPEAEPPAATSRAAPSRTKTPRAMSEKEIFQQSLRDQDFRIRLKEEREEQEWFWREAGEGEAAA